MRTAKIILWALLMPLILLAPIFAQERDEDEPEVTARVVRISVIEGDAQVKRQDETDWERATANLPLVEGDEIATENNSRIEIQIDRHTFLRIAEKSLVRFTTLRDEGVGVSVPEGVLSVRVLNFNSGRRFLEIDAPQTTVSVLEAGLYRIESGENNSDSVRVTVTEGGKARVYSDNSGFTLKSGRSARVFLAGNNVGEWETDSADRHADNFESWVLNRDSVIAKRMRNARYDSFYDDDVYGAEDLDEFGEWIHTRAYGYVWKPYRTTTGRYANWSPYRYGHWRWVSPFGWTWVNDEPWGWATYHHGRWVYVDSEWCWTPYSYYRPRRSWWRPALVVLIASSNNYCWYPLGYNHRYYNYNRHYQRSRHHRRDRNDRDDRRSPGPVRTNNPPVVTPPVVTPPVVVAQDPRQPGVPPFQRIPHTGVITVAQDEFGKRMRGGTVAPLELAKKVLAQQRSDIENSPPILPVGWEETKKRGVKTEILIENPRYAKSQATVKTGAIDRKIGVPMDEEIKKRVYNGRIPIERTPPTQTDSETKRQTDSPRTRRDTGAVRRPEKTADENQTPPIIAPRERENRKDENQSPPIIAPREQRNDENRKPRARPKSDENQSPPIIAPPPQREERKYEPPPREEKPREQPRYEPPPRREEPPRYEPPPKREEPRNDPPKERPSPPLETKREKPEKDG